MCTESKTDLGSSQWWEEDLEDHLERTFRRFSDSVLTAVSGVHRRSEPKPPGAGNSKLAAAVPGLDFLGVFWCSSRISKGGGSREEVEHVERNRRESHPQDPPDIMVALGLSLNVFYFVCGEKRWDIWGKPILEPQSQPERNGWNSPVPTISYVDFKLVPYWNSQTSFWVGLGFQDEIHLPHPSAGLPTCSMTSADRPSDPKRRTALPGGRAEGFLGTSLSKWRRPSPGARGFEVAWRSPGVESPRLVVPTSVGLSSMSMWMYGKTTRK